VSANPATVGSDREFSLGGVKFGREVAVVALAAAVLPVLNHYFNPSAALIPYLPWLQHIRAGYLIYAFDIVLLYLPLPILAALLLLRRGPADYGMRLGDWRRGLRWTLLYCLVATAVLLAVVAVTEVGPYYRGFFYAPGRMPALRDHLALIAVNLALMFAWEFLWRGFTLFGLGRHIGPGPAILLQAVPFTILHFGKPFIETLASPLLGIVYGIVSWRTGSFYYAVLMHLYTFVLTNFLAVGLLG